MIKAQDTNQIGEKELPHGQSTPFTPTALNLRKQKAIPIDKAVGASALMAYKWHCTRTP